MICVEKESLLMSCMQVFESHIILARVNTREHHNEMWLGKNLQTIIHSWLKLNQKIHLNRHYAMNTDAGGYVVKLPRRIFW